jgi:para-nitrobenzyl esterase
MKLKITDLANFQTFMSAQFGAKAPEMMKLYPANTDGEVKKALDDLCSDMFFRITRDTTRAMAKIQEQTYMYHFNHGPEAQKAHPLGIHHGYELKYFFGNLLTPEFTEVDRTVSNQVMGYLARFCATGNPNPEGEAAKGVVTWPRYTLAEGKRDEKAPKTDEAFLLIDNPFQPRRAFNHKRLDTLEAMK